MNLCPSSLGTCRTPGCHRPTSDVYFRPYRVPPAGMMNGPSTIALCQRHADEWDTLDVPPAWVGDGLLTDFAQREPEAAGVLQAQRVSAPIVVPTEKTLELFVNV